MRSSGFTAAFVLALSTAVFALPSASSKYEVFEKMAQIPSGWRELPVKVNEEKTLSMRFHLAYQNVPEFEEKLLEMSDPEHSTYGDHMSREHVEMMLQPREDTTNSVVRWLAENGFDAERLTVKHGSVKVNMSVGEAQKLLHADYKYYRSEDGADQRTVLRTLEYSLPKALHEHVTMVQPTTMFGMSPMRSTISKIEKTPEDTAFSAAELKLKVDVDAACNETITPTCLAELYGFADYKVKGKGWLGVSGFLEQYAQYDDLSVFLKKYKPEAAADGNFTFTSIKGGLNTQNPPSTNDYAEANLDIQYTVGISYPIKNTYFQTPGRPPFVPDLDVTENDSEPYLDYLEYLLDQDELPNVITTSYGESEQTVPLSYRIQTCNMFAQLGARGVSVLFSSGDSGPGWSCLSNDGKNTTKFLPTYPAACPWVTSVGGTVHVKPEEAVYFSSGGFSETWPVPSYQKKAVDAYFKNHPDAWKPWAKYFNQTGRGFPDVSAQGYNYHVILADGDYLIGGTSASSPAFAGIVSLVNDVRLSKGKKALGFLNPLFYKNPDAFTDIVNGRSTGCDGNRWGDPIPGGPAIIPGAGWDAVSGWDPVTGLGTPKFTKMRNL